MKRLFFILIFIGLFVFNSHAQYHERDWKWHPYASLTKGGKIFMVLYFGYNVKGYDGKVRWKIENKTAKSIFGIDLGKQTYELNNGEVIEKSGIDFKSRELVPGETAMTLAFPIESNEKVGVKKVTVASPEIVIDFGKNKVYEWNKLGTIDISPQ